MVAEGIVSLGILSSIFIDNNEIYYFNKQRKNVSPLHKIMSNLR